MDRTDCAYLINSTPKYYYLVHFHCALIRRYAPTLAWPIYIATEVPSDTILKRCVKEFGVKIIPLERKDRFFLESRLAASLLISEPYIFPIQEDFLLERKPDEEAIREALTLMTYDKTISSMRFMPCPGPLVEKVFQGWASLKGSDYMFSFQATLWRREDYILYLSALLDIPEDAYDSLCPPGLLEDKRKKWIQVDFNLAENQVGQRKFMEVLGDKQHLGWVRQGKQPNAVYISPWPYRPTAVEKGVLGQWAKDLAAREGYSLSST